MEKQIQAVKTLIEMATQADSADAMRYTQAAVNAANALAQIQNIQKSQA